MEPKAGEVREQPIESIQRQRVARACDSCYRRKIKCDAASPRCDWCRHNDSLCTYERRVVRKKGSSKDDRAQLLARIDRLEKLLTSSLGKGSRGSSPQAVESPAETSGLATLHFAGLSLGTINSNTGIPVFSEQGQRWIRSRTGENASLERLGALSQSWHSSTDFARSTSSMMNTQISIELPDRQLVEHYLDLYQHSFTCNAFPVVDPIRFRNTISTAYALTSGPSTPNVQEYRAQACVHAFLAFISSFNFGIRAPLITNPEDNAYYAHRLLMFCCRLDASIETLQVASMLMMFHNLSGNLHYAIFEMSICTRMIYMLGAHTITYPSCTDPEITSTSSSYRERYLLRSIFWTVYILDKELSLRTGQPPCLQDEYCDLTIPPLYVQRLYPYIMGYQIEESYDSLHLFPGHPTLSIIKSKAYSALYSTRAAHKSDTELLRDIRELDDDLERWRLSIPLTHRPTISYTVPENVNTVLSVMFHLDYCHCVAAIHQPVSSLGKFGDLELAEGVGTSLALSIEASRSSLTCLEKTYQLIGDDRFWIILYYPMSAILTVFYSILHRPLDPKSLQDLELLISVPITIHKIPVLRLSKNETNQIQLIDELVESLTTLGRCAIKKARGGDVRMQGY